MTMKIDIQPMVTVTTRAAEKILSLMIENGLEGSYLRLIVDGMGCSGSEYGMAFSDAPREGDTVLDSNGLRVLVDPFARMCLDGATVDYIDTPQGPDFKIDNPNAVTDSACSSCAASCE